ncbi:hypothetical protein C7M84_005627 [Penaeus vannamei]|uniref:Uncharacterized protein n=1 Tax=Penaeus vannamei TaxID=6689 RepID=A0A3R7Q4E6_PENVA|nr:hypothetical protein C7M84_005627 [Penaeus vannamei]
MHWFGASAAPCHASRSTVRLYRRGRRRLFQLCVQLHAFIIKSGGGECSTPIPDLISISTCPRLRERRGGGAASSSSRASSIPSLPRENRRLACLTRAALNHAFVSEALEGGVAGGGRGRRRITLFPNQTVAVSAHEPCEELRVTAPPFRTDARRRFTDGSARADRRQGSAVRMRMRRLRKTGTEYAASRGRRRCGDLTAGRTAFIMPSGKGGSLWAGRWQHCEPLSPTGCRGGSNRAQRSNLASRVRGTRSKRHALRPPCNTNVDASTEGMAASKDAGEHTHPDQRITSLCSHTRCEIESPFRSFLMALSSLPHPASSALCLPTWHPFPAPTPWHLHTSMSKPLSPIPVPLHPGIVKPLLLYDPLAVAPSSSQPLRPKRAGTHTLNRFFPPPLSACPAVLGAGNDEGELLWSWSPSLLGAATAP